MGIIRRRLRRRARARDHSPWADNSNNSIPTQPEMNTSYHRRRPRTIMRPITQHTLNYFPGRSNNKHFIIVVMPGSWPESILLSPGPGWELCLRGGTDFFLLLPLSLSWSRSTVDTSQFVGSAAAGASWAPRLLAFVVVPCPMRDSRRRRRGRQPRVVMVGEGEQVGRGWKTVL